MLPQQDAGVKPPDGTANPKVAKQKGGPLGGAHLAATSGGTAEQQAQRCPRCDSLNTKFCYYNNYSLSQPRHFCKNCRRYWTKGGALRNVPVGGGCRKNKRLKHRDPSCLAALADLDASGPSSILSSIGIPGFAPSTSSFIQELANEGHRLAYSRLGMQMLDKRFLTDNDHHHHQHPASSTTQDLFTIGGPPPALGAFEPSFPALTYSKGDSSQPLLFHPQHASEFTPFFDSMNSPSSLTPTLDHLSSFTAGTPTAGHHVNATSINNTANMDAAQMSLIHHMPMNGMQASHEEQQAMQASSGGGSFNQEEESAEMSLRRSKGKSIVSSLSDWGQQLQGVAPPMPTANGTDSCFFVPPQFGAATDNGLWNVSWPEMHAALAGSAGAMLH